MCLRIIRRSHITRCTCMEKREARTSARRPQRESFDDARRLQWWRNCHCEKVNTTDPEKESVPKPGRRRFRREGAPRKVDG
jgi:hypothetical protein